MYTHPSIIWGMVSTSPAFCVGSVACEQRVKRPWVTLGVAGCLNFPGGAIALMIDLLTIDLLIWNTQEF